MALHRYTREYTLMHEITRKNQRRHNHWTRQTPRCPTCGKFVSKPEPVNGRIKYVCGVCGRAQLEYVGVRGESESSP